MRVEKTRGLKGEQLVRPVNQSLGIRTRSQARYEEEPLQMGLSKKSKKNISRRTYRGRQQCPVLTPVRSPHPSEGQSEYSSVSMPILNPALTPTPSPTPTLPIPSTSKQWPMPTSIPTSLPPPMSIPKTLRTPTPSTPACMVLPTPTLSTPSTSKQWPMPTPIPEKLPPSPSVRSPSVIFITPTSRPPRMPSATSTIPTPGRTSMPRRNERLPTAHHFARAFAYVRLLNELFSAHPNGEFRVLCKELEEVNKKLLHAQMVTAFQLKQREMP